jgi:multicomponent Na+:H+ antiporter subunit A
MIRRSIILTTTVNGLTPILLLVSLFLTFRGHNAPGGGFAGGLVMASAIVLRYLASGAPGIRSLRIDPIVLTGVGLAVAVGIGTASLIGTGSFLNSSLWNFTLPLIGQIHFVTASIFDIGVHIVVVGVVMAILIALVEADDEVARQQAAEPLQAGEQTDHSGDVS